MTERPTPATARSPEVARRPAVGAAVGASTFRPATNDGPRGLRRDLARRRSTTTRPARTSPRSPTTSRPVLRLYAHLRSTDPDGFVVAEQVDGPGGRADRRVRLVVAPRARSGSCRCCSSCRGSRASGLGRALLERVLPDRPGARSLATCTDSAQPISNGAVRLARDGSARCRSSGSSACPSDPDALRAAARQASGRSRSTRSGDGAATGCSASRPRRRAGRPRSGGRRLRPIRRTTTSCRREGRIGFLYRDRDGRHAVGYGYASEAGRVGPVAVRDAACSVRSSATSSRPCGRAARSASGCRARPARRSTPLLRAGFRLDGFPVLLCWDQPVRRLQPLRADLAGSALAPAATGTVAGLPARTAVVASRSTWLLLSCPRTEPR